MSECLFGSGLRAAEGSKVALKLSLNDKAMMAVCALVSALALAAVAVGAVSLAGVGSSSLGSFASMSTSSLVTVVVAGSLLATAVGSVAIMIAKKQRKAALIALLATITVMATSMIVACACGLQGLGIMAELSRESILVGVGAAFLMASLAVVCVLASISRVEKKKIEEQTKVEKLFKQINEELQAIHDKFSKRVSLKATMDLVEEIRDLMLKASNLKLPSNRDALLLILVSLEGKMQGLFTQIQTAKSVVGEEKGNEVVALTAIEEAMKKFSSTIKELEDEVKSIDVVDGLELKGKAVQVLSSLLEELIATLEAMEASGSNPKRVDALQALKNLEKALKEITAEDVVADVLAPNTMEVNARNFQAIVIDTMEVNARNFKAIVIEKVLGASAEVQANIEAKADCLCKAVESLKAEITVEELSPAV